MSVPLLLGPAVPGVEHTEAHLAVVVQVGVEAYRVVSGRLQVDHHGRVRVVRWEVDVQFETTVGVGCLCWAGYQYLQ